MKKASKILLVYLCSLLVISFLFSLIGLKRNSLEMDALKITLTPMMIATIIGGIIALKYTVSEKSFKIFLIIYSCLWALRIVMIFLGTQIGEVIFLNRTFRFNLIIANYYENVSRIGTPLPFILYWLINYFFTREDSSGGTGNKRDETAVAAKDEGSLTNLKRDVTDPYNRR